MLPDSSLAAAGDFRVPTIAELQAAERPPPPGFASRWAAATAIASATSTTAFPAHQNFAPGRFCDHGRRPQRRSPGQQSDNHGGRGQNVLFEDGHVQFLTTSRPSGASDDIFVNDDDQVAAGVHQDDSVIASSGVTPIIYVKGARVCGAGGSGLGTGDWRLEKPLDCVGGDPAVDRGRRGG